MPDRLQAQRRTILLALAVEGGLGLIALVLIRLFGLPLGPTLTLDARSLLSALTGVLVLGAVFLVVTFSPWAPFARIRRQLDAVLSQLFEGFAGPGARRRLSPAALAAVLGVSLLAGVGEELFFRSFLQQGLAGLAEALLPGARGASPAALIAAVVVTNLIFAAAHLITPTYAMIAFLMGIVLSGVFVASNSIIAAALCHGIYDFLALSYYLRRRLRTRAPGAGPTHTQNHTQNRDGDTQEADS